MGICWGLIGPAGICFTLKGAENLRSGGPLLIWLGLKGPDEVCLALSSPDVACLGSKTPEMDLSILDDATSGKFPSLNPS